MCLLGLRQTENGFVAKMGQFTSISWGVNWVESDGVHLLLVVVLLLLSS